MLVGLVALALVGLASAAPAPLPRTPAPRSLELLTDINKIQDYWGSQRPYKPTPASFFGVKNTGLPDGCGYEQIHLLHRHGARYPTDFGEDGQNDLIFVAKLLDISAKGGQNTFFGDLDFLNAYTYQLGLSLLVPSGSAMEYQSATDFWSTRGRLLYNATAGQPYYNATLQNGTTRPNLVFRTTSQARVLASAYAWAAGFFGPTNTSAQYDLVAMAEEGTNNTLTWDCDNANIPAISYTGDDAVYEFIPLYLQKATDRINSYIVEGSHSFNTNDTYAMQSICTYEFAAFGDSDFCYLFTEKEWEGFEYSLDLEYYYDYGFGQATGRAQGIGYVQELIARLTHQYITEADSTVNTTLDSDPATFPLDQPLYMDMSHDDVQVSVITALSIDYFRGALPITASAPSPSRHFRISYMTPFAARLNTEVIACNSSSPLEKKKASRVLYSPAQNGYDAATASHKFVRMTLNGGVVPLASIEGGKCEGRGDGLCPLGAFLESQANATVKANYGYACVTGNYTLANFEPDSGTIFA